MSTPPGPEVVVDRDDPQGFTMVVGGVPSSYVHLGDPLRLDFEYVRWAGDLLDVLRPAGEPLHTVHIGGAGCTLPRYVAATRPGSRQLVVEADEPLAELVRASFGTAGFRLRVGDARLELPRLRQGESDLVVADVFESSVMPVHVTTLEWVRELQRLLRPGGTIVVAGATSGDASPAELQRIFFLELSVLGVTMGSKEDLVGLLNLLVRTGVRPIIDTELPLARAAEGLARLEAGSQFGKIVLMP